MAPEIITVSRFLYGKYTGMSELKLGTQYQGAIVTAEIIAPGVTPGRQSITHKLLNERFQPMNGRRLPTYNGVKDYFKLKKLAGGYDGDPPPTTEISEPSTLGVIALSLAAMCYIRRRKRSV